MSERELLYQLLDEIPDAKISYIIGYVQGLTANNDEYPNSDTISSFYDGDQMLKNESGQKFTSTDKLFEELEN